MIFMKFICLQIGSDYKSMISEIYHQSCVEECPNQCSNRWKYLDIIGDGSINVDSSIKVSCGKTLRFNMILLSTRKK